MRTEVAPGCACASANGKTSKSAEGRLSALRSAHRASTHALRESAGECLLIGNDNAALRDQSRDQPRGCYVEGVIRRARALRNKPHCFQPAVRSAPGDAGNLISPALLDRNLHKPVGHRKIDAR